MIEFNRVIDGLLRYINKNIFPKMMPEQKAIVRTVLGMGLEKIENIKPLLIENPFIKTFGIINSNGEVDVDFVLKHLKKGIEEEGKVIVKMPLIKIPFIGEINLLGNSITFTSTDIDDIYREITGGTL